jgi:hypothetical protein
MEAACFNVYASVGLDCFVDAMYRHYASLPSLGNMDQWAMNKAINVVRDAPITEIEDDGRWRIEFSPLADWHRLNTSGDLETLPLRLKGAMSRSRARVYGILHGLGVDDEDVEKLVILALLDRFYNDDEGRMDPAVVMASMFDPRGEQVKLCVLSVSPMDDGTSAARMHDTDIEDMCDFDERRHMVLEVLPRARFESLTRPVRIRGRVSLSIDTSQ